MGRRKKRFECGHFGYGAYCHLCHDKEKEIEKKKMEKKAKFLYVKSNGDYVSNVPIEVQKKAVDKFMKLKAQQQIYSNIQAKRMTTIRQRKIVVLRVGRSYRLICKQTGRDFQWIELLSHESYNDKLKRGGWN